MEGVSAADENGCIQKAEMKPSVQIEDEIMNRVKYEARVKLEDLIADLCRLHTIPIGALWLIFEEETEKDIRKAVDRLVDQRRVFWDTDTRLRKVR